MGVSDPKHRPGQALSLPKLDERITRLEDLLKAETRERIDPKVLDKGKLFKLIASQELDSDTYPSGSMPNSGLAQPASYMRDVGEHVYVYKSSGPQTINNTAQDVVTFDVVGNDVSAQGSNLIYDGTSNLVLQRSGIYVVGASIRVSATGGFGWELFFMGSASVEISAQQYPNGIVHMTAVSPPAWYPKGEEIWLELANGTGANADVLVSSYMTLSRLGDVTNDRPIDG